MKECRYLDTENKTTIMCQHVSTRYCTKRRAIRKFTRYAVRTGITNRGKWPRRQVPTIMLFDEFDYLSCPFYKKIDYEAIREAKIKQEKIHEEKSNKWKRYYI